MLTSTGPISRRDGAASSGRSSACHALGGLGQQLATLLRILGGHAARLERRRAPDRVVQPLAITAASSAASRGLAAGAPSARITARAP